KLKEFRVVGKRGASTADFDYNDFAVTDGFWYEDAPPVGDMAGNNQPLYFSRTRLVGPSHFISRGSANFHETVSGRGPNHFIGDVSFTADSTGAMYISQNFGSIFDGNLTVTRNMAGITEFFLAGQNQAITGDFNYINKHGGHSSMGTFGGLTLIGGKVNVDYESHVEYAPFGFSRIKNLTGGGIISIKNAGRTIMEMDTLLLESFSIVGVNGPAVSDIDRNFITTSTGFLFEDDPNHQNDVYFSRNTVRGPAVIRMKGEGVFFDTYSGRGENFYGANVTYEVVGEGEIRIDHYFPVHYFGNLTFASVEGINPFNDRIYFRGENNATFLHNGVEEGVLPGFRINKENDARLILSQPLVNTQKIEF